MKKLFSIIRPPPKPVYNIHDPHGLSIITQLCVGPSKLKFYKFKHNFNQWWSHGGNGGTSYICYLDGHI